MRSIKFGVSPRILLSGYARFRPLFIPFAAILALGVAFFGNSLWGSEKTFIVDAVVSGATITFNGNHNSWYLGEAVICTPTRRRQRSVSVTSDNEVCDQRAYKVRIDSEKIIQWPDGASVRMRFGETGRLEFFVLDEVSGHAEKTLIVLPHDFFSKNGALSFSGSVIFGRTIKTGAKDILLDGSYKVRESHVVSAMLGKQTYEVASSELTRGDQVRVVDGVSFKTSSLGYGHLSRSLDVEGATRLVFQSSPGDHALEISSFGMKQPAVMKPDWIDSTLASPYVLIVGLFISLVISVLELHSFSRKE